MKARRHDFPDAEAAYVLAATVVDEVKDARNVAALAGCRCNAAGVDALRDGARLLRESAEHALRAAEAMERRANEEDPRVIMLPLALQERREAG